MALSKTYLLAVIVGHTRKQPGAAGLAPPFPTGKMRYEYFWNSELAEMIQAQTDNNSIACNIFYRDGVGIRGAYREVESWYDSYPPDTPKAAVELHFNASYTRAKGTETLYGSNTASRQWANALQMHIADIYDRQGKTDRGMRNLRPGSRGYTNVTQIHPSALIEPFFGDDYSDALLGTNRKPQLANAIIKAFISYVKAEPRIKTVQESLFEQLVGVYSGTEVEFPHLKEVSIAQWALESDYGRSELAQKYLNFAGMKWRSEMRGLATPVHYNAHDGAGIYCQFASLDDFIAGYWAFLERSPYRGWRMNSATPEDFINFIGETWASDHRYARKILRILQTRKPETSPPAILARNVQSTKITLPVKATAIFRQLIQQHNRSEPGIADEIKQVITAQWGIEANWGNSHLAKCHYNFAGMEWGKDMEGRAAKITYRSTDGKEGEYCRFLDTASFIDCYWQRIKHTAEFSDWHKNIDTPEAFSYFLGEKWRPSDQEYATTIMARITSFDKFQAL
jgi:uncharacterized FlgJ-related protein